MVISFGLTAFWGLHHIRRTAGQLGWIIAAIVVAYGLTLAVNTVRVTVSVVLYNCDIYGGWITVSRVHRVVGIGLFLGALWLHSIVLKRAIALYSRLFDVDEQPRKTECSGWPVLGWYLPGSVAVPIINRSWNQAVPGFVEHCFTVLAAVLFAWALIMGTRRLWEIRPRCLGWSAWVVVQSCCQGGDSFPPKPPP